MYIKNNGHMPKKWQLSEDLLRPPWSTTTCLATVDTKNKRVTALTPETATKNFRVIDIIFKLALYATVLIPIICLATRTYYRYTYDVKNPTIQKTDQIGMDVLKPLLVEEEELYKLLSSQWITYESVIQSFDVSPSSWSDPLAKAFLYDELQNLLSGLEMLPEADQKVAQLKESIMRALPLVKGDKKALSMIQPTGLLNQINSCYMNAAIQPLLAFYHITKNLPEKLQKSNEESPDDFKKKEHIYEAFHTLASAYESKKSPQVLGSLVGELRRRIFEAGFVEGGFLDPRDVKSMQDSGSFFELFLFITGQQLEEITITSALDGDKKPVGHQVVEYEPLGVPQLKFSGSIQEAVDHYSLPPPDGGVNWKLKNGFVAPFLQRESKITSLPPDLLVMRVENRKIDPVIDGKIQAHTLFVDTPAPRDATYELVGFCQNIQQAHWTSVIKSSIGWTFCNDSQVREIDPKDPSFQIPASYVVYRKIKSD